MIEHVPHIHLIKLYKDKYLYDVNTNGIMHISDEVFNLLDAILKTGDISKEQIKEKYYSMSTEAQSDIDYMLKNGFLYDRNENVVFHHPETDRLETYYESNLNVVTLQVTQNCNLRCKYCVYSGSYVNRTHMNKRMNIETAMRAIDFLYAHSTNSNQITIGFYGGEPLLEIDLIKKCVAYAEKLFAGKKLMFNMTSNATLLNAEIIDFLASHSFNLTVSLDGPSNIQDRNRIFAASNKGTFDTVIKNLELIKSVRPDYINHIAFNAVIDLKQDVSCTSEFFMTYDLVKEIAVSGNYVDSNNLKDKDQDYIPPEFYANSNYEIFKVYLNSCTDLLENYKSSLYTFHLGVIHNQMMERNIFNKHKNCTDCPGGQCLPGIQRLFVNVDGKMFPCERINESSDVLCIGNIWDGFNVENAKHILNVSKITEDECKKCWCYKICEQCCGKAEKDGLLDKNRRLSFCQATRYSSEECIKNYIILKKFGCKI